jgi:hypothetical protein
MTSVPVRLERANEQIENPGGLTGTAGRAGYYLFLRTSGDFRVVITVEAGYALTAG